MPARARQRPRLHGLLPGIWLRCHRLLQQRLLLLPALGCGRFPGACTPNAPKYGTSAFSISCLAANVTVSGVHALPGDAYIRWIAAADCADEVDGATHMLVPQRVCDFVRAAPGSTPEGYRVTCASDGSAGLFEVCDRSCTSCSVHTP